MLVTFRKVNNNEETQIKIRTDSNAVGVPQMRSRPRLDGGPLSQASILATARFMSTEGSLMSAPETGSTLTINGQNVGNYDYFVTGTTTISSFSASSWFTSTQDTASSWIIVNGNLTINTGITMIPPVRKLFTVVYVRGNLTLTGTASISMSARGANHSGTGTSGGYTAPVDIRIGSGTFSAVTNPEIPATGGSGGNAFTGAINVSGKNDGSAGTNGGTGGGGSGYRYLSGTSGAGSAGTCFTGGTGGGGSTGGTAGAGESNGGIGGSYAATPASGGTGNPGGNQGAGIYQGTAGTGGVLIVICEGTLSGSGSFRAEGVEGQRFDSGRVGGGSSGGGSITVLYQTDSSTTTLAATGGGDRSGNTGGGGTGTTRKLDIGTN